MTSVRRSYMQAIVLIPLFAWVGCSGGEPDARSREQLAQDDLKADIEALANVPAVSAQDLCPPGRGMRCFAKQITAVNGEAVTPDATTPQPGWLGAPDIRAAYKLPTTGGAGRLVGIVDAFDAPNAERDMGIYRTFYGLPSCTTANGCFRKLNQRGQPGPYPPADAGWAAEIMVDLDMVSATCPDCTIVLVEADTSNGVDLGPCVALAHQLGAISVNNSYGGPESDPDSVKSFDFYNQPGTLVVASSGDDGYLKTPNDAMMILQEIAFPAASPYVLSIGGTTLTRSAGSTRGWAETAWSGAGSGCSKTQTKPTWQKDPGCTKRMVADIAAVGDPRTGVATYNGTWSAIGGTSVSAPVIAGIAGLYGITDPSWPYSHANAFFDVITGSNGACGAGNYQCNGVAGFDGPTGLGTPNAALFPPPPPAMDGGQPGTGGTAGAGGAGGPTGSGGAGIGTGGAGGTTGNGGSSVTPGTGGASTGAGGDPTGGGGDPIGSGGSPTGGAGTSPTGGTGGSATVATTTGSGVTPKANQGDSGCSCRVGSSTTPRQNLAGLIVLGIGLIRGRRRARRAPVTS